MRHRNNKIPSLFLVICLLGFPQISETIYTPSLPDLARSLGIGMDLAEFTLTLYFIGFAFGVFAYGSLADAIGRRASMLIGIMVYTLGSVGCSYSHSIEALLFFRFIQAFGAAAGSVVTQTILRDLYTGPERNRIFSIVSAALSFSPAIGPVIGGFVDQYFHWRANFYVLSVMGILLGMASFLTLTETKPTASPGDRSWSSGFGKLLKEMTFDLKLISYALLIGGCNGIIFSYYAEAPYIFIELLKLKPAQYGFLGLVVASSFFLASLLSIRLNRSYSSEETVRIGAIITGLGSLLLTFVFGFMHESSHLYISFWAALIFSLILVFIGIGVMIPNCLSHALVKYRDRSGTAGSIFGFTYYWIIAGFTGVMGIIHNGKAITMPLYFFSLSLGMMIISYLGLREYSKGIKSQEQLLTKPS